MERPWYDDALIYHIYSLALAKVPFENDYATNGSGIAEIEKWIPHIKGMGFNTVLLAPVLKSRTHGYDVTDYFEIDKRMGTNEGFKTLVDRFHDNGIRVVLDSVFNHCGRDFFAFQALLHGDRKFADWFCGVDFSRQSPLGDPFTYNTWDGHYSLPKFNLKNEETKKYLFEAAVFWIDSFGIDAMRLDCANVLDSGFMSQLRLTTEKRKQDFWLMGEVVHGDYTKWVNDAVLHSVTNYVLYASLFSSHNTNNLYELAYCVQNSVPANGLPLYNFLDNHDQGRIASKVQNPEHLRTLYALLFTLPGVPSVYYGSEWGIKADKENGSDNALRPYIDIENRAGNSTWLTGHISKLAQIRQSEKALRQGTYRQIYLEYRRPFVFERCHENQRIFVAVNIAGKEESVNLKAHGNRKLLDLLSGERFDPWRISLKPYSARILKEEQT